MSSGVTLKEARALASRGYGWEDIHARGVPARVARLIVWGTGTDDQLSALWLRDRGKAAAQAPQRAAASEVLCDNPGSALALADKPPISADE